jgi:hypothetical protein
MSLQMESLSARFARERAALEADAAAARDVATSQRAALEASYAARVSELEILGSDMEHIRAALAAALTKPTANGAVPDLQAVLDALGKVSAGEQAALQRVMRLQQEEMLKDALALPLGAEPRQSRKDIAAAEQEQHKSARGWFGAIMRALGMGDK